MLNSPKYSDNALSEMLNERSFFAESKSLFFRWLRKMNGIGALCKFFLFCSTLFDAGLKMKCRFEAVRMILPFSCLSSQGPVLVFRLIASLSVDFE